MPDSPPRRRLLVVDDDAAVRTILERSLASHGFDVQLAASADDAIRIVKSTRVPLDLVILDVVLPAPGSTAVLEELKGLMHPLRVLVISGYDEASVRRSSLIAGLEHEPRYRLLEKPFETAALLDEVDRLLEASEAVIEVVSGEWPVPDDAA